MIRRTRYTGPVRTAGYATATTPPAKPPCDECRGPVSRYNDTGRCWACIKRIGPPPELEFAVPSLRRIPKGHAENCECFTRREPVLNSDGTQKRKYRKSGSPVYTIRVTCPECLEDRDIQYGGGTTGYLCRTDYRAVCARCAKRRAASARFRGNQRQEAA